MISGKALPADRAGDLTPGAILSWPVEAVRFGQLIIGAVIASEFTASNLSAGEN